MFPGDDGKEFICGDLHKDDTATPVLEHDLPGRAPVQGDPCPGKEVHGSGTKDGKFVPVNRLVPGALDPQKHDYRWMLLCLDAATGKIVWEKTAYEGKPRGRKHRSNTYASETPATDGEAQRILAQLVGRGQDG